MMKLLRFCIIGIYLLGASIPLLWMAISSIKPERFTTAVNPNFIPALGRDVYGGVDFSVPAEVQNNARSALEAWEKADPFTRGLPGERDIARAKAFAEGRIPGYEDLRVILAWLKDNQATIRNHPSWESRGKNWQNWMGRGGEPAIAWLVGLNEKMNEKDAQWKNSVLFPPNLLGYTGLNRPFIESQTNTYFDYLFNSLVIGVLSTLAAVLMGTSTAYGFSRFRIAGSKDWLFYILSTRFLPPLAVVIPILLMFRKLNLTDSHLGLIILYTAFNLSLAVWLMKGFIDEIPKAYEEAALVDGYSRLRVFWRIILPQAATGMAVTAVFCLISAWNEYGFAKILNGYEAQTVPVYFAGLQGSVKGIPWQRVSAGSLMFVVPIVVFTVLARRHLLRGVTFGTIKQ